jgi:hypothetical protein
MTNQIKKNGFGRVRLPIIAHNNTKRHSISTISQPPKNKITIKFADGTRVILFPVMFDESIYRDDEVPQAGSNLMRKPYGRLGPWFHHGSI